MGSDDPPPSPPTLGVENVKIREYSEIRRDPLQSLQQNVIIDRNIVKIISKIIIGNNNM